MSAGNILGVLLAGGQSRRMGGGDKCLQLLGGKSLLSHAIARARPQATALILNANGDAMRFAGYDVPIVADSIGGFAGPLAGILTALEYASKRHRDCSHVASFATDAPFFPADLVARLIAAAESQAAPLACASSGGRTHPVFGLWPLSLADDLRHAMTQQDIRKVDIWTARHGIATADYPALPFDPFFNINRPEDLAEAERMLAG